MSHIFATGLSQPQRTIIRSAAVDLLSQLKRPTGYLADVIAWGGIVRSYTDQPDIQMIMKQVQRTPAIVVQLGTRRFETLSTTRREFKSDVQLLVYFVNQNLRDLGLGRHELDETARRDDHADPGLDVMMEHALELLCGAFPATTPTIKQIIPRSEEELVTWPEMTIWLQTYDIVTTQLTLSPHKEFRTPAQLLTSIGLRVATEPEPLRPAAATSPTTIDTDPFAP